MQQTILNVMIFALLLLNIVAIFDTHIKAKIKKSRIFGEKNQVSRTFDSITKSKFIQRYENLISGALRHRNKGNLAHNILLSITLITLFIFFYFINIGQYFFAILMPVAINYVIIYALKEMEYDVQYEIEKQLPGVIDDIIQKFSKYNDLKTVIYEVSLDTVKPLKPHLEKLYKQMFFKEHSIALNEFADEIDNIWIHSLVFILISNQEDTSKQVVIDNLKSLRNMLDQEKNLQSQKQNDNMYGLALNYFICAATVIANIAILSLVPTAKNYFFKDINGIVAFFIGYGMIFITVIVNLRNTFKKRKKV